MRGKWLLISGAVILVAVAVGALSLLRREPVEPVAPATLSQPPVAFTGSEVSLHGRIRAQQVVPVAVPVEGTIEAFFVEVGQEVYEGELLAQIRNTQIAAERDAATVELERARSRVDSLESRVIEVRLEASRARVDASRARDELERAEKVFLRQQLLHSEGATPRLTYEKSRKEFDAAKTEYLNLDELARLAEDRATDQLRNLDEARKALAERNREYEQIGDLLAAAQVYSPVDGLVVARRGQPGEVVRPEIEDLFQIAVNLALLEVVVEPEPPVLERIRPGQEAVVQVAETLEAIQGKVKEVRGNEVIVEFTSPSPAVTPGLTAQVRIKLT